MKNPFVYGLPYVHFIMIFREKIRRFIAFILTVAMVVCNVPISTFAAQRYPSELDGWKVRAIWSETLTTDCEWSAAEDSSKQPKVNISYRLENANKDYPAGSVQFTVPGIRNLAFACFAIESMLKNKLHTAIVYATRLPRGGIDPDVCYTMPRCEQAKEAILARLGLKGIHFTIKRMDANSEKTIVRDPDEYVLVLSAYSSTGAGSNITVQTRSENGNVTTPVDLAGVYCDNVTNIIPGPQSSDERNVRIRCAMEIAYLVRKSAELMAQQYEGDSLRQNGCFNTAMLALYYAHPGGRSILGTCLTPGLAGVFMKDIFADEPFSPLKETQRKTVLQAVNRIERGHVGEDRILLCMSDTLIKNAGISEEAYRNLRYR